MKISHIIPKNRPSSIIVRNYDNEKIVHVPSVIPLELIERLPDEVGGWGIKYKNYVPKELNQFVEFEKYEQIKIKEIGYNVLVLVDASLHANLDSAGIYKHLL
mgnify:FL=1